jgi:hypothetical protein
LPTSLPAPTVTVGCSTTLLNRPAPYLQHRLGAIGIGGHDDPSFGGEVEIPQLVASRQRCHEELSRVPAGPVSSKGWVGGAVNDGLALRKPRASDRDRIVTTRPSRFEDVGRIFPAIREFKGPAVIVIDRPLRRRCDRVGKR